MIHAVGWSNTTFEPARPGRLCRGRERWVEAWEEEQAPSLWRLVLSGAVFTDDSARDALRGLTRCGVDIGGMLKALFPEDSLLAFKEEGELARIPDYVETEDQWWAWRSGGQRRDPCQRWRSVVEDPEEIGRLAYVARCSTPMGRPCSNSWPRSNRIKAPRQVRSFLRDATPS